MIIYNEPMKIELKGTELYVNGHKHEHHIRKLQKMREVLMSHVEALCEEDFNVYHMYRSVYSNIALRFDMTLLPARMLGEEFNKTYGHYHPQVEEGLSFPEIYQVLSGDAIFLLQKKTHDGSVDALAVDVKEHDVVLIPPNYGHVAINPSNEKPLLTSNLVFNGFESDYEDYERYHGASHYYTMEGLTQNTNYVVRTFDRIAAEELNKRNSFSCSDLLFEFMKNPDQFDFLETPSLKFKA